MNNKHGSNRSDDDREFPALLVIIGLFLVTIVWVGVFRPNLLDNLPFKSATAQPPQAPVAATIQEDTPSPPQPAPSPGEEPSREATSAPAEAVDAGGKQGEFYRYTDENGTIHLVDNPGNIPEKYRQQTKTYNSHKQTTPVRVVNSQVLVPVTLRYGYQEVQATLVLDTGCSTTTISGKLADRLGIDPARTKAGTSRLADGRFVPTRMAVIGQLSVGPKSKSSLEVSVMASAGPQELADGLLGMNFLRDYRYQIDMAGQKIHWN
jgi:hypothetical protein